MAGELGIDSARRNVDWKRIVFILTGIILFAVVYVSPPWPDAVDPMNPWPGRSTICWPMPTAT